MDAEKEKIRKKLIERYGQISNHGCSGCPHASSCGPNFEIEINIKERKESEKES